MYNNQQTPEIFASTKGLKKSLVKTSLPGGILQICSH